MFGGVLRSPLSVLRAARSVGDGSLWERKSRSRARRTANGERRTPNRVSSRAVPRLLAVLLLVSACAGVVPESVSVPARGQIELEIQPNPVLARRVEGETWTFPFEVVLREAGGVDIEIEEIRAAVTIAGVAVFTQVVDPEEAERRGYDMTLEAGGVLHARFSPTRRVPDSRLLEMARAELTVVAIDRYGRRSQASRTVRVDLEEE